jgi:aspartyl-tRNA(Asn)/glutamyl-tRNA(Gln) amidotransferase subunit A
MRRRGGAPLAFFLDHVGPMTRTVRDNALMLQVIAGHNSGDPGSADEGHDFRRLQFQPRLR